MSSSCTLGCLLRELKVLREKSKLCDALLAERESMYKMLQDKDLEINELAQKSQEQAEEIKELKDKNLELDRMCGLSDGLLHEYCTRLTYYQQRYPNLF